MSQRKTKLQLTWTGKENRPLLEPLILLEDPEKSSLIQKHCIDEG